MPVADPYPPEHVPVLSRGKHRSPRKGACFMEFASYLAGEPWSDHPQCTHPLLAALARVVNDHTSDEGRQQLAPLIPSVIGLTSDDLHMDVRIALLCARTALPVVGFERQRVMAVGILSCHRVLADLDERDQHSCDEGSRSALEQAPHAVEWARQFIDEVTPSNKNFRKIAAPSIVSNAVQGIASACVPEPDVLLRRLLADAITLCRQLVFPCAATTTSSTAGCPDAHHSSDPVGYR